MRLIDADALLEKMYKYSDNEGAKMPYGDDDSLIHRDSACFLIEKAPTINSESHWIPVTERLPEKDGEYLTTWIDAQKKLCVNVFLVENGVWYWNQKYIFPNWRIIAWMPLPEPWKGE